MHIFQRKNDFIIYNYIKLVILNEVIGEINNI